MTKVKHFVLKTDATVAADGQTDVVKVKNATRVTLLGRATLAGTTPSFKAQAQTKDANGNWHNLGSGSTITATGLVKEVGIAGPFGEDFRIDIDVDVADGNEAYTLVDLSLHVEHG
jgi:hypothetical protein